MDRLVATNQMTTFPIERLVYTSIATQVMGTQALFDLLNQARIKNAKLGITGHLLYADGVFTQCIEGPASSIEILWQSLSRDARHENVVVMTRAQVMTRNFEGWDMAFSSYRYLNSLNMPGFFPLDSRGVSEKSVLCSGF